MGKKIIYSADTFGGDWDDFWHYTVFVSENKELVEKWVEKYNRILKEYKEFYKKFESYEMFDDGWIKDEYLDYHERWYKLKETRLAKLGEIEIRK